MHLYISYSFQAQCFLQETSPVGVCEMNIICLYYFFFFHLALQLSPSSAMAPFQQASDLQICLSGCPSCISDNTGQTKCISIFPTTLSTSCPPPHLVGGPHARSPRLCDHAVTLPFLSFLIQSSTKLCSVYFADIPGFPLLVPPPGSLSTAAADAGPATPLQIAAAVHLFTRLLSPSFPSKLPSRCH